MLSKTQWGMIAFLVGLPIAMQILLMLSNPRYVLLILNYAPAGLVILVFLTIVHFLVLYSRLHKYNKSRTKRKTSDVTGFPFRYVWVLFSSFLLFTLPALCVVFLYPVLVDLLSMDFTGMAQR